MMRLVPSIGPWLPWVGGILPYCVLLGGRAAELYFFSILGKPAPNFPEKGTLFGVAKAGPAMAAFHEHLLSQGFKKRLDGSDKRWKGKVGYFREDLGSLEFYFPRDGSRKNPHLSGLSASPDPWVGLLLEDPHVVELQYLKRNYSIKIPQTGRFVLTHGLQIKGGQRASAGRLFEASQHWFLLLSLLPQNEELGEEALNDLSEIRPASLIKELHQNLRENGPGSPAWEGAQKSFLQAFPGIKAVDLIKWYWKFLPAIQKVLGERRSER